MSEQLERRMIRFLEDMVRNKDTAVSWEAWVYDANNLLRAYDEELGILPHD